MTEYAHKPLSLNDFVFFNRQLAEMLKTELPLVPSIKAIAKEANKSARDTLNQVAENVEKGMPYSEAIDRKSVV
jgi:type II secretory pathway component PulF